MLTRVRRALRARDDETTPLRVPDGVAFGRGGAGTSGDGEPDPADSTPTEMFVAVPAGGATQEADAAEPATGSTTAATAEPAAPEPEAPARPRPVGKGHRLPPPAPLPGVVAGTPAPAGTSPTSGRTGALGRAALVIVVLAVVGVLVIVVGHGGPDSRGVHDQAQDVPALQVDPAPIQLGTVGQPGASPDVALPGGVSAGLPANALQGGLPLAPGRAPGPAPAGTAAATLASLTAWAQQLAPATDIPARALQSYGLADLIMRRVAPSCHLSWVTVAGLGRIESNHGRFRGSSVAPDGQVTPPIIGVPLDGTNGNTTIFDGSGSYAQAMGPLQFIPSTWERWGTDTHGTGRADVNNYDDAAVTAGRYLCAAGGDLATGSGWRQAVLAYNNSDDYGRRVYAAADAYAHRRSV